MDYTVQSATDYYPYGKALRTYGKERYQSTYHERDVESGFDYRGARFYDGETVRFNSLDPLAADFASWSPYNYVMGNPLSLVDSDGRNPDKPGWFARATQAVSEVAATATAYVSGMANAVASNAVGGAPNTRLDPSSFGDYAQEAAIGQVYGDAISVAVGSVAVVAGAVIGTGGTLATAGLGTVPAAAVGTAIGAQGAVLAGSGARNLMAAGDDNNFGNYAPDRKLPRDKNGNPVPDADANGANTQLGKKKSRTGDDYTQAREFDENGNPVKDIDFTDHGRPQNHTNPHQHRYIPNETGGTPKRGTAEPLDDM